MLEPRLLLDGASMLSSMVAAGQAVATTWQGQSTYMVPGHWILSAPGVTDGANMLRARMLASDAADPGTPEVVIGESLGSDGLFRLEAPPSATYEQVLQAVSDVPGFAYVEPDFLVWADSIPNDPQFSSLYAFNNTGQSSGTFDADIDAPEAWSVDSGHGSVVVGVIDTGTDYTHADLAANIWTNSGEIPGNGIDDDGNGYIDDVHGYNFVGANSSDPMDDHFHGTHTAGTIGAVGNNGVGVTGVDWNVKIMPIKFLNSGGSGTTTDAIEAINYATMMRMRGVNIRVLSNSWGGGQYSSALEAAINQSAAAGILFVASAGNNGGNSDNTPQYPASYNCPNIIAVAATDRTDAMASFSNYGLTSVDIAAPGVDIYSTLPGNAYGLLSGTSMAAPMVAGVAALAFDLAPGATYQQVRDAILNGADRIASQAGKTVTGGRLNAYNTLTLMGMCVSSSQPAEGATVVTPPVDFTIDFSEAYDPASVGATDLHVNGLPADSVTMRDTDTLDFHFNTSPVTAQGPQTMAMSSGAIRRARDLADLGAWSAGFTYDQVVLGVTSTSPASLSIANLPLSTIRVVFNEPFDPATLDASDLMLGRGSVTGVTRVNSTTADFAVSGITTEGTVTMVIAAGSLNDLYGCPMAAFSGSFETDLATAPLPVPLVQINPPGSMAYQGIATGMISAGDTDSYTIQLDAGQLVSLSLDVTAGLRPVVTLRAPDGSVLASTTANAPGLDAVIQAAQAAVAGTYRVDVSGVGITDGDYCLTVTLNAALETEAHDWAANDTLGTAQNLAGIFVPLSGGHMATVLGAAGGDDWYRLDLLSGQAATAATNVLTTVGTAAIDLLDASGVLLASGQIGISNAYQAITNFRAQAAGAYYLRVRASGDYSLVVTKDALFSLEPSSPSNAQMLGPGQPAIGAIHSGVNSSTKSYLISVAAGDHLVISTTTPGDGVGQFVNTLDPLVELYDPAGNKVAADDNGGSDGRNARLDWTAASAGLYRVVVSSASSEGEYVLQVAGATGAATDTFAVTSSTPADGTSLGSAAIQCTVTFSQGLLLGSVSADDLLVDGVPATTVTITSGNVLVFTLPALSKGHHTLSLAAGALTDLQGTALPAWSASFDLDLTPPRVIASSIVENDVLPTGDLTYQVTFSKQMDVKWLSGLDDLLYLSGESSGKHIPATYAYDSTGRILTATFTALPDDNYTLMLFDYRFHDTGNQILDGEARWPLPSGNGVAGGDFVVDFRTDITSTDLPATLNPVMPDSPISQGTTPVAIINTATDVDDYVLNVEPGQTLALVIHPAGAMLQPIVDLYAPGQPTPIATATAVGVGLDAVLQATPVTGGAYTIRVRSAGASSGAYTVQAVLNAAIENETHNGPANGLSAVAQDLDPSFRSLGGSVSQGAVLGNLPFDANSAADWYSFTLTAGQRATLVAASPFFYQLGLDLYDSTGNVLLASAAGDNATIGDFVAPADGVYYARITGLSDYSLVITKGAGALAPVFSIASSSLAYNALLTAMPSQVVFTLSSPVSTGSLSANDLLIDGVAATSVTVTNGTTITFNLPILGDGHHTMTVAAGAFVNLQDQGVASFSGAFDLDTRDPRVIASSIAENGTVPAGTVTITVTFSRPMNVAGLSSGDMQLNYTSGSGGYRLSTMSYDATGRTLTLVYISVPEGSYTLTLFSAYTQFGITTGFEDSTGLPLDGEPHWPLPSGDGYCGGDFVLHFKANTAYNGSIPLASTSPSGSLIYQGTVLAGPIGSTDINDYVLNVDPGQTLALAIHPTDSMLQPIVDLYAPGQPSPIASASALGVGLDAVLAATAVTGGTYTIRVHSAGGSTGAYTVQAVLNAAIESESHNGPADNLPTVAQNIDASFISLGGSASRGAVLGSLPPSIMGSLPTGTNTNPDWYSFTLNAGQAASIVSSSTLCYLDLYDSTGTVLLSSMAPGSSAAAIRNFVPSTTGLYYVRVTGMSNYSLVVSRSAVLDNGSNTTTATAQDISPASSAMGYTSGSDYYAFYVNAGDVLTLTTATPADGSGEFLNRLDPVLYLYNPSGTQLATNDNGAADGRNALLTYTAATSGRYLARVGNVGTSAGEYVLTVTGATGSLPAFTITASTPINTAHLAAVPTQITLTLSSAVLNGSVSAGNLLIDGLATATNVTVINGTTLTFDVPNLTVAHHTFSILAGAFVSLQNQAVTAFSGAFDVDTSLPRVVACSVTEGGTLGVDTSTTITITFSKPIKTTNIGTDDISCMGAFLGGRTPSFTFDGSGQILTMLWNSLPQDNFTLTLLSGNNRFEDMAGVDLDGEANWPLPSGNGIAGGDFVVHFSVDSTTTAITSLTSRPTPGGLVYDSYVYPAITSPTDVDTYTISLAPGQTLTLVESLTTSALVPAMELYAPGSSSPMAWAVASAAGKNALIQVAPVSVGGVYTVTLHGDSGTMGSLSCRFILNALAEAEQYSGPTNDQLADAQDLDPSMIAMGGNVWRGAVLGSLPTTANNTPDWYRLSLSAGQAATVALATITTSNPTLSASLYDASGTLLCSTGPGSTATLRDFVAPASGNYFVQVTGLKSYSLVATRAAALDNGNNSSISLAQALGRSTAVMGNTSGSDYYAIDASAGDVLTLTTATPGDGPGLPANLLDPVLYIRDAGGAVLASDGDSAPDGRNASLVYTVPTAGRYYVQLGAGASGGDYVLTATGATGDPPAFVVTAMTPASGSALEASPASITLTLGDQVLANTLQPSDLRVNGQPATAVTFVSDTSVRFDLPALADGSYSVTVAAGAFTDLQGTPVSAYNGSFSVDTAAPRVMASTLAEGDVIPTGALVYKVTFSKTMAISGITSSDLTCVGNTTGTRTPSLAWDATSRQLTLTFSSLAADNYTLTLLSGNGRFEDVNGLDLDGEARWPLPSGDGTPGGNFVLHFRTDAGMVPVTYPTDTPDLATASDHGISNSDNLTNLNNASGSALTFYVTHAAAGALVTLYVDGVAVGSAGAVGNTATIITDGSHVLSDGEHVFTAAQILPGYSQSVMSAALTVSIDATAPIAAVPDLSSDFDTGVSNSDNITRGITPQFKLSASDPLVGGFSSGLHELALTSDDGGSVYIFGSILTNYPYSLPTLAEGSRTITATAYDYAGNSTTVTLSMMVDRTAPRVSTFGISSTLSSWALGTVDSSVWTTGRASPTAWWSRINRFVLGFNETVKATSSLALTGQNAAGIGLTQQGSGIASQLSWDSANCLASDRYNLLLQAGAITDLAGNWMAGDWQSELSVLVADVSGSGVVDFKDYLTLEQNFNTHQGGPILAADFNGDGNVNFSDYLILEVNFNTRAVAAPTQLQGVLDTLQMVALQQPLADESTAMATQTADFITARPATEALARRSFVAMPTPKGATRWPGNVITRQSRASGHAPYRRAVAPDPALADPLVDWISLWHGLL